MAVCWKCNGTGVVFIVWDVVICDDCGGYGIQEAKDDKSVPKV